MNIFQQFIKSLYSPKHIAAFRLQGIGKTILYLFFILLISALPFFIHFSQLAINGVSSAKQAITEEFPAFTIENGTLTTEDMKTRNFTSNGVEIFFDPTGKMTPADFVDKSQTVGILKHTMVISTAGEAQQFSYSTFSGDLTLSSQQLSDFLDSFRSYLVIILPVIFFVYYMFISAGGFIKVSIFAAIALLFSKQLGRKLVYRQAWRMAVYAITPSLTLFALISLTGVVVPFSFFIDWALISIMLYAAVKALPVPKQKKTVSHE